MDPLEHDLTIKNKISLDYWFKKIPYEGLVDNNSSDPFYTISQKMSFDHLFSLEKIGKDNPLAKFILYIAHYHLLLSRYLNHNPLIFTPPLISESSADSPLFLKCDHLDDSEFLKNYIQKFKSEFQESLLHKRYDFNEFIEKARKFNDSIDSIFQIGFSYNTISNTISLHPSTVCFLEIYPEQDGIEIKFKSKNTFFEKWKAQQFVGHYIELLSNLESNFNKPLREVEILSASDKATLKNFNPLPSFYFKEKTVIDLFEEQVAKTPHNTALVYENTTLTYYELNQKVNELAHFIRNNYVIEQGCLIGIVLEKTDWLVIAILAVLKSGAAYVPIDTQYPRNRINLMIHDNDFKFVITNTKHADLLINGEATILLLDTLSNVISQEEKHNLQKINDKNDTVYMIFTSGSTGKPKGVLVKHHSFTNLITWYNEALDTTQEDRFLLIASISFDLAQKNLFAPLVAGASLYLSERIQGDYETMARTIADTRISILNAAPSAFYPLLNKKNNDSFRKLSSLKKVILGGEPINMKYFYEWKKTAFCNATLINSYGPTECTDVVSHYAVNNLRWEMSNLVPIGKPIKNTLLYVLDKHQKLSPIGVEGEIYIGGEGVSKGYLNDNQLTESKFFSNFLDDGFLYKTGDRGKWLPDGNLEFIGRADYQIKIRGVRVELGEVETILKNHPQINDAIVVTKQGKSEEEIHLIGYYIPNQSVKEQDLRAYLLSQLPRHMIPTYLISTEEFPLTPSGKVDRTSLSNKAQNSFQTTAIISPTNNVEEKLIEIWEEILEKKGIGITDNFFELGGHSLTIMRLLHKIADTFHVKLKFHEVLNETTIAKLALKINDAAQEEKETENSTNLKAPGKSYFSAYPSQERLYVLSKGNNFYNMLNVWKLSGKFSMADLNKSINHLMNRHEILRTNFLYADRELKQFIHPFRTYKIQEIKAHELNEVQLLSRILKENEFFDLNNGQLFSLKAYISSDSELYLVLNIHHIITDGWGIKILFEELLTCYSAFATNALPSLKPLSYQYKDLIELKKQQGYDIQTQAFWEKQLEKFRNDELPLDFERTDTRTYDGHAHGFDITDVDSQKVRAICRDQNMSLFSFYLAVVNLVLFKWLNRSQITVGGIVAEREEKNFTDQIGFLLNNIPITTNIDPKKELFHFLNECKRNLHEHLQHKDYPFVEMVKRIKSDFHSSRHPIYDILVFEEINHHNGYPIILNDLHIDSKQVEAGIVSKYDLIFFIEDTSGKIATQIIYNTRLFHSDTIVKLNNSLKKIIEKVIDSRSNTTSVNQILNQLS